MAKKFTVKLKHDSEHFIKKAQAASRKEGISFSGDARQGTFLALGVKGSYTIEDGTAYVDITEKPILIPWKMVEVMMHDFFS